MRAKIICLLLLWAGFMTSAGPVQGASLDTTALLYQNLMRSSWNLSPEREVPAPRREVTRDGGRETHTLSFSDRELGHFRLMIDGPRGFTVYERALPIVFVTAGFFAGTQPIGLLKNVPNAKQLIIVAFEYSPNPEAALQKPEELARTLLQVPGRLYLSFKWLEKQGWFNQGRLHVLGISLGSLYLPSALSLLQEDGFGYASLIIAFGGARMKEPLFQVLRENLGERETNEALKVLLPITAPYDPRLYLPTLEGRKLVIHGSKDMTFQSRTQRALDETLPGPKLTCTIEGGHIDMDKTHEVELTLGLLDQWIFGGDWRRISQEQTVCE
ncbi:MAG: alpha/beta hydrolase [Bdellovibrionaceae bacterium]|nr:alpha/beta hydrolase [Pseudobdellovibrionaceae bacterium]